MSKKIILISLAISLVAICGIWWFSGWIFPPTDDPRINHRLNSLKSGEAASLAELLGKDAERICWINPSYTYYRHANLGEKYVSQMLGAQIEKLPLDLGDEEGGNHYVFIRLSTHEVRTLKIGSSWQEYREKTNINWCASVQGGQIERNGEGLWTFITSNKELFKLPE